MLQNLLECVKKYCTHRSAMFSANNFQGLKTGEKVSLKRTITKEDVLNFAKLTEDYNYIHTNSVKSIVHGAFLNGLLSRIIGTKLPGPGTIVAEQILRFPKPCYVGDTVEFTVEITEIRKITKCKYVCVANSSKVVMEGEAKLFTNPKIMKKILAMD